MQKMEFILFRQIIERVIKMNNINFELYGKNVKVITIYGDEIIGNFEEDFEEEQEIAINKVIIRYDEVKEMFEFNE